MPVTLTDFISRYEPGAGAEMHLVHCTTVGTGLSALTVGALEPRACPVYGDDLLYFFYGRPAFKPAAGLGASNIVDYAPICLVLDPTVIVQAARILPFDSGGFARYQQLIGPGLPLNDFELGVDRQTPRRLIKAFYQTPRNYYDQAPTLRDADIPLSGRTARAYARLIADPAIRETDDRCGTIEVQVSKAVPLKDALRAIVAPAVLFDDPEIQEAIKTCPGVSLLPYSTFGRFSPEGLTYALYDRVNDFHLQMGAYV